MNTLDKLKDIIREITGTDLSDVTEDSAAFTDINLSIAERFDVVMHIEDEWGIDIDRDESEQWENISDVLETIKRGVES